MAYLNDVEEGGETAFPAADNATYNADVRTLSVVKFSLEFQTFRIIFKILLMYCFPCNVLSRVILYMCFSSISSDAMFSISRSHLLLPQLKLSV